MTNTNALCNGRVVYVHNDAEITVVLLRLLEAWDAHNLSTDTADVAEIPGHVRCIIRAKSFPMHRSICQLEVTG
jgi:hypothetical protein